MSITKPKSQTILIVSSSLDMTTCRPVAEELVHLGYDVVVYKADKVANAEVALEISTDEKRGLEVHYDGRQLFLDAVVAAWWRRPNSFSADQIEWAKQLNLDGERRAIQASLWDMIPQRAWLNIPDRIRHAQNKIGQLLMAREVGFSIPLTIISNRWEIINSSLPEDIIVKVTNGFLYGKLRTDEMKMLYTTRLANDLAQLPLAYNPFPGYWQPYLQKRREWRITVVGNNTYDAAIYTTEEAKTDWRSQQHDSTKVIFKNEQFPEDQKSKCIEFLTKFGLKFGAFDFIEDADGKITFLECNTNSPKIW